MLDAVTNKLAVEVPRKDLRESNRNFILKKNSNFGTKPAYTAPTGKDSGAPAKDLPTNHFPKKSTTTTSLSNINISTKDTSGNSSPTRWASRLTVPKRRRMPENDISPPTTRVPSPSPILMPRPKSPAELDQLCNTRRDFDGIAKDVYATFRAIEAEYQRPVSSIFSSKTVPETKEAYSRAVKSYTSLMKKIQDTHTHVTSRASAYSFQRMRLERQAMKGEVEVMSLWIYCMEVWCELLGDVEEELKDEVLLLGEGL